jgi:hypothetical protein
LPSTLASNELSVLTMFTKAVPTTPLKALAGLLVANGLIWPSAHAAIRLDVSHRPGFV